MDSARTGRLRKASIKLLNGPLCQGQEQAFALVSYTAPSARFATPQYVLDTSVDRFTAPKNTAIVAVNTMSLKPGQEQYLAPTSYAVAGAVVNPTTAWQRVVLDGPPDSPPPCGS